MDKQFLIPEDILEVDFTVADLTNFNNRFQTESVPAGTMLLNSGDQLKEIMLLTSGEISTFSKSYVASNKIKPPVCIGMKSYLKQEVVSTDLITTSNCDIIKAPGGDFIDFWLRSPGRALSLMQELICEQEIYDGIANSLTDRNMKNSKLRLAQWLDHWHDKIVNNQGRGISIGLKELESATGMNKTELLQALMECRDDSNFKLSFNS